MTMSKELVKKIAIVGVGLIGGSLALALKKSAVVHTVVGWDTDKENLLLAKHLGVVDVAATSMEQAVSDSDLVILAVPVGSMLRAAREAIAFMPVGAVLSDTGSV